MAKKNVNVELADNAPLSDNLGSVQAPAQTNSKNNKKDKSADNKFSAFFKRIGKRFKEMGSELKKVNWPTWKVTLASLGTVLVVVLAFLIITMGFDTFCVWLLKLLTGAEF